MGTHQDQGGGKAGRRDAVRARPLQLHRQMDAEQAFCHIAANCCAQIAANQPAVASGDAPEALHQMRVGLRRLASALKLYRPLLLLPQQLQHELAWLQGELAPARDWDVLAGETLPRVARCMPDNMELLLVRLAAESYADALRAAAAQAVCTERYTELLRNLDGWLHARAWRQACSSRQLRRLAQPAASFAQTLLADSGKRLLKRGRKLGKAAGKALPRQRHRVRIAAKGARYAAEFFHALVTRDGAYVAALKALQDELGWLNDVHVADSLLKVLNKGESGRDGSADFARGCVAAALRRKGKLRGRWQAFVAARRPRVQ